MYIYRFLFTVQTKGMHTVNWGQNGKNPTLRTQHKPNCREAEYKADLFSFEGRSFFFLEGAAVNHEWQ